MKPAFAALVAGMLALLAGLSGWAAVLISVGAGYCLVRFSTERGGGGDPVDRRGKAQAPPRPVPLVEPEMLDALPLGVLLIGRDRTLSLVNRAAREMFGAHIEPGMHLSELRTPALIELVEMVFDGGSSALREFSITREATRHLRAEAQWFVATPEDGETPSVLVAVEDVTRHHKASVLRRDFVANASHELKTPLAVVSGLTETLLGHAQDDPEARTRFLAMIGDQTERMARLVEDLLSLNRIEINERLLPDTEVDLTSIVVEAANALGPFARAEGGRIDVEGQEDRRPVIADQAELGQVFRNLIENALKHGGHPNVVRVSFIENPSDRPGMIGIEVRDHGHGIPAVHLPRLTERFYRVSEGMSRERGGTGLGLAIVKHVLIRHRGHLSINSTVGEGSVFTVWLPVSSSG